MVQTPTWIMDIIIITIRCGSMKHVFIKHIIVCVDFNMFDMNNRANIMIYNERRYNYSTDRLKYTCILDINILRVYSYR